MLLEAILDTPDLVDRLFEVLRPEREAPSQEASGMSWETFYFVCFLVGFLFSLLSFLAGFGIASAPAARLHAHAGSWRGRRTQDSPFNFGTIAAFLAWFGGTGYLLSRYSSIWALLALGIAVVSGLAAPPWFSGFCSRCCCSTSSELDPADYEMVGVLGRVSSPMREGGTGEMIFSQDGVAPRGRAK